MGKDEGVDFDKYYDIGNKGVEVTGSDYMKNKFTEEKDPDPPDYSNRIPIGHDWKTGQLKWINVNDDDRFGIFARTGSGKTFLLKSIHSRLFLGGYKVLHLSDVKNDFADMDHGQGIQKHHMNLIETNKMKEQRQPIPVNMYMPKFMGEQYYNGPPKKDNFHAFAYSLNDLSESDFLQLISADSESKKNLALEMFDNIEEGTNFSDLYDILDDSEANDMTKRTVRSSLETLERQEVVSNRYQKSPLDTIDETVVALAFEHWDKFKRKSMEKMEIYISITIRKVMDQMRERELEGPLSMIVDEAHAFAPADGNSISRDDIVDVINLGRAYGIPMFFASQSKSHMPEENFMNQMNKFFISKTVPQKERREILQAANIYEQGDAQRNKWQRIFKEMDQYQWMMIDKKKSEWTIIDILSPLCAHG